MSVICQVHNLRLCRSSLKIALNGLVGKNQVNFATPSYFYVNQTKQNAALEVLDAQSRPHKPKIEPAWKPTPSTDSSNLLQNYLKLSKVRLTTLVVVTTMAGYAVAPAPFEWTAFALSIAGTGLLSGAANAINQFHEVPFDAQMSRTKHRVLVCGRLTPLHSMAFACAASLSGLGILYYGVNGLTATLGLTNLLLYTSVYTPLKRISILNTWVGSIVGAIPPLMGWAACANSLGAGAFLMAALLYSWQFPHFNALSWNLRPDYSRAGYRMMAVTHPALCRKVALRHTVAIQLLSTIAPLLDTTNWWFLLECTPLNVYFIYLAYQFYKDSSSATSRKLFRYSLIHLPLLMVLFLVNKKKWFVFKETSEQTDNVDESYGQRTEVKGFDPMFNAITGLNGSGKSNILDAICFVLGISNLSHVRVNSLQDLIFKSGQAGINRATVSIIFDNQNAIQCPPGFENTKEITISRTVAIGGKNKYMINGITVTGTKVQDLFCSVQMNVNNPHFLIMQGRITKVLNMKPPEILSMVEEAAGTRMYEVKRQTTQKLIEKKDSKLAEFQAVINEELSPKLQKLKSEREQYLKYQRIERELEHLVGIYQAWQYFEAKRNFVKAEQALENGQKTITEFGEKIDQNKEAVDQLMKEIETITHNNKSEGSKELQEIEARLKKKETEEAKINAAVKKVQDNIASEEKQKKQLEKNIAGVEQTINTKQNELNQVQSLCETIKENDRKNTEALALAEQKYEALCAGLEVNDQGETETLAEQLMAANEEAARARTEIKQASMQLVFCEKQLATKQKDAKSSSSENGNDKANLRKTETKVAQLQSSIEKLNFSEERMSELSNRRRTLYHEVRTLRDRVDSFEARHPHIAFKYSDPMPNFDRSRVKGVVCKLIQCKNISYATALETAAAGKLYNVVVDTEATSRLILQKGALKTRTTFIPLNKISANKMSQETINLAQKLVGKENCLPALSLINYDRSLQSAMEFIFGNVFICKDINVAKKVTFHNSIRKKCVTLDGDSTDPNGILSGGATLKGQSILQMIEEIKQIEAELRQKTQELSQIDSELNSMSKTQEQYNTIKHERDIAKNQLDLLKQRLLNTTFAREQSEIDDLKAQITQLKEQMASCQDIETKSNKLAEGLKTKINGSSGYKEKRLKDAKNEMQTAKTKADKSKEEWRQREQNYETLTLEIQELQKSFESNKQQLVAQEELIAKLEEECAKASEGLSAMKDAVNEIQAEVKRCKAAITEKNKDVQSKVKQKDQLLAENTELELQIKKHSHEISDLKAACKTSKQREQEYIKRIGKNTNYLEGAEKLTDNEGQDLERRIKVGREKKHTLGRTVNAQAQSMFEVEEKRFDDIIRKQKIVEVDRSKLIRTIKELDRKKESALKLAFEQVSKDFGSIFATLLPGANAKLGVLQGKSILQGLEIKVALGNVWKESLTELSGGQRSLAALSLILAMLLFKPAPIYILDEVDAALDLSHTQNIGSMLKSHFNKSQFIVVSLKDGMFNNANVLYRTKFIDGMSAVQRTENTHKNH
ncbi:hypothetical protein D910_09714 [Dendroctonus ponderosae]|uniref:Protoheme IX farnesyltransferase, mitochondrial n=1 Tax=Dendroctonus ponderosae TaxID=77166 RepID=U4UQS3_DENPD|nr:hypothetical protein D910_09714 [Dendroctonus ponderosae]KAH1014711.1 hypothetical protein HUJ05_012553 [Dendroctonus ponderosae]